MNARDNPAAFWRGCFGGMSPKHGGTTAVRPWGSMFLGTKFLSDKYPVESKKNQPLWADAHVSSVTPDELPRGLICQKKSMSQ
jgi:hypothetical protein